jgi:hypothetical protein
LLNVSDQADVKALVVHCSTSWSITPEEANARVDRKEKERRMARRSMYIGKRKRPREREEREQRERGGKGREGGSLVIPPLHFIFWRVNIRSRRSIPKSEQANNAPQTYSALLPAHARKQGHTTIFLTGNVIETKARGTQNARFGRLRVKCNRHTCISRGRNSSSYRPHPAARASA